MQITLPVRPIKQETLNEELRRQLGSQYQSLSLLSNSVIVGIKDYDVPQETGEKLFAGEISQDDIKQLRDDYEKRCFDAVSKIVESHNHTAPAPSEIAQASRVPYREIVLDRGSSINPELLDAEFKAELGAAYHGFVGGETLRLLLDKSATPEEENTARQILNRHDMSKPSPVQKTMKAKEDRVEALLSQETLNQTEVSELIKLLALRR